MTKIGIIIVNWQSWQMTEECLASLAKLKFDNYELLVVDNGSTDASVAQLEIWQKKQPFVLLKLPRNLGYVEANNLAIKQALALGCTDLMLLNNDTTVEPDFMGFLVGALDQDAKLGLVSPKIMFYSEKKKIWFAGGTYYPFIKKPVHQDYGRLDTGEIKVLRITAWISGCCMLIKREVLEKIGLFDPDYYFNCEDVDFCERAKKAGFKIAVVPAAVIYHKFAGSSGGKYSPLYTYFRVRNVLLYFKKTKQWLPLLLNLFIVPSQAGLTALLARRPEGMRGILLAVRDFIGGKYGAGSAQQLKS